MSCASSPSAADVFQMSLSSGGTLSMLSISSRAPASSWALGLYAPSDWRFFLAVNTMKVKPMISISTQRQSNGMATISHGTTCLLACFCKGRRRGHRDRWWVKNNLCDLNLWIYYFSYKLTPPVLHRGQHGSLIQAVISIKSPSPPETF